VTVALERERGIPPLVRRVSWRMWMIGRIPAYGVAWLGFGLFLLTTVGGFVVAALLGVAFAIGSLIEAVGTPLGSIRTDFAVMLGMVALVTAGGVGLHRRRAAQNGSAELGMWLRNRAVHLIEEWGDAADRWPSRRRAPAATPSAQMAVRPSAHTAGTSGSLVADWSSAAPVGWRFWKVTPESNGSVSPVLGSVTIDSVWGDRRVEARCMDPVAAARGGHERIPVLECTCGIYALKEPLMPVYAAGGVWAAGQVALTGRVLEGRRGYRAEKAEIVGSLRVVAACRYRRTRGPCAGAIRIGATSEGYEAVCLAHRHLLGESVPMIDRQQLQARLELRYGIDVSVSYGGLSWT